MMERGKYNVETVRRIIRGIISGISENEKILNKAIEDDKKKGYRVNICELMDTIKSYVEYRGGLVNVNSKTQRIDGIGDIAVIYNGDIMIAVEMVMKALYTHNNIILVPDVITSLTVCLIEIIQQTVEDNRYGFKADICKSMDDICNNKLITDSAIFIGDKYDYLKFKKRYDREVIYNEYGYISVYVDSAEFKEYLLHMDKYAYEKNMHIEYYKDEPEAVERINKITNINTVAIFTKDLKKATRIIRDVRATSIYVNKTPFDNYKFNFDDDKILIKADLF